MNGRGAQEALMSNMYDFIVVGAGASGCAIASRLANSKCRSSVLLLEAGGSNDGVDHMSGAERFKVAFKPGSKLNWGYKTAAQFGQQIDYSRGKGLGGSTAINFCGWVVGADEDYNEWARIVGDQTFAWSHVKNTLKKIERLHQGIPASFAHHIDPKTEDHGTEGMIDVAYGTQWQDSVQDVFAAAEQTGLGLNPDVNSGNPIGMGMGTACIYNSTRITSSSAYLYGRPTNLTVKTDATVARVLFDDKTAIGVETVDGQRYLAKHEVIISGGAINSPQLLMLSGIGDPAELSTNAIEVIHGLPQVGKNLQDHCFSTAGIVLKKKCSEAETKQSPTPMGWFKLPRVEASQEYKDLPETVRTYLVKSTVPHWELATHTPFFDDEKVEQDEEVFSAICLVMNPQSRGTVELNSQNPIDPPVIDPKFLSHSFDERVIIEAMREMLRYFQADVFKGRTVRTIGWPEDDSDEIILKQCQENLRSSWHACGTVAMAKHEKSGCVDSDFRVFGLKGLRVADMSVVPLIPNNHTQTTAYIIGEIAAEKIVREYGLDDVRGQDGKARL